MSNGATERLADVASLSEAYTSALGDCVDALAATVDRYVDDRPYDDPLGRVRESETVCDVRRRELTDALATLRDADATPFARDGVPAGDLAELYHDLDEVANAAEQVAEELAAIEPTLPADCARGVREMAALAVDATALLVDLVDDYVRALHRPDGRVRMSDPVQRIRGLESQCDELRIHVVERAFATAPEATALTCRHLVTALDAVADAVEDVTDHLLYASGGRTWIDRPDGPADG